MPKHNGEVKIQVICTEHQLFNAQYKRRRAETKAFLLVLLQWKRPQTSKQRKRRSFFVF